MYANNPYAQAGWYNPENPLSINNGTWGSQSPPQPSIYGALPGAIPASSPNIITFHFVSFNPSILNCSVIGPQGHKYYSIVTSSPNIGASTLVFNKDNQTAAAIGWHQQPSVEVYGTVQQQEASRWLGLSSDRSHRTMEFRGKWYAWVHREGTISLFTVGPTPPELWARVSREQDSVKLEIKTQAVQAGILDAVILAVTLFHSGRNFG